MSDIRNRAVALLKAFFASDNAAERQGIFNGAFADAERNPAGSINYAGSADEFASQAIDKLLAFQGAQRGRHSLSVLLTYMTTCRGRLTEADYFEIPRILDEPHAVPNRGEELAYLRKLLEDQKLERAENHAALDLTAETTAPGRTHLDVDPDEMQELRRHLDYESREEKVQRSFSDFVEAFQELRREGVRQLALLGDPGAGKSTTLRRLARHLARTAANDGLAPLPVLLRLDALPSRQPFRDFLAASAPEIGWAIDALAAKERIVLLLDGLNELAGGPEAIENLKQEISSKVAVISCRREDYQGPLDLGIGSICLKPLTPAQIRETVENWLSKARGRSDGALEEAERFFWSLAGDPRLASVWRTWDRAGASEEEFWTLADPSNCPAAWKETSAEEDRLWREFIPRSLMPLARNPLMLRMLYVVWGLKRTLPRNRSGLFAGFVSQLLSREQCAEEVRVSLEDLAFLMQRTARTVVARREAEQSLGAASVKMLVGASLLEGTQELRFYHQLLQEYFAASYLKRHLDSLPAGDLWPSSGWWERNGWEETAILLAGIYSDDCTPVIDWLAAAQPEVAADCILKSGAVCPEATLRRLQSQWAPRLIGPQSDPQPEARAAVGRALGKLNLDNRPGVGVRPNGLPDIDWVEIPAGEFTYQEGERRRNERFWIARYPITNAQYKAFLDAKDGYADDRWWQGLTDPERTPQPGYWTESNHPRETVSWWEAMAFCAWLTAKMEDKPSKEIRLPLEWEWERAARWRDGREYPWGNGCPSGYANIDEGWVNGPHALDRTSPVGIYLAGASKEGVLDLSGNIWEWCWNEYSKPDRVRKSGLEPRVLRGGSWSFGPEDARSDVRDPNPSEDRDFSIGFRVVSASPIRLGP